MHDPTLHRQTSRGRTNSRGKCDCCPYGYHLDLDFVRYCEKVSASGLLQSSTLPRPSRRRRESRESLLGLAPSQNSLLYKTEPRRKPTELITERAFSDDLEKAVLDFEKMFKSSSRPKQSEDSQSPADKHPRIDIKFNTIARDRLRDPFDELKINGTNNASAEILQEIRHQMAASLSRMRQLEEEVKIIPNLQNQLKKLRWENRRLIKLLETAEKKSESNEKVLNDKLIVELRDTALHKRTIGTSCCILNRDVGTSHYIPLTTVGTNPLSPGVWLLNHKETNTVAAQLAHKSENTDPTTTANVGVNTSTVIPSNKSTNTSSTYSDKGVNTSLSCSDHNRRLSIARDPEPKPQTMETGVQTGARKSFTLDFGIQTDNYLIKVPMVDACIQYNESVQKLPSFHFGSQHDSPPTKVPICHVGVQFNTETIKPVSKDISVQFDSDPRRNIFFNDISTQMDEPIRHVKEVGVQNKASISHIGILAKHFGIDNTTQTTKILKKDAGFTVNTMPRIPIKKSIGSNTEVEKVLEKKIPSVVSRLTDTADLLKRSHIAVNTIKTKFSNAATETKGLDDCSKKIEPTQKPRQSTKSTLPETKEKPKQSSIPVYSPSIRQSRSLEKDAPVAEVEEKSSPHTSAVLSKPYEKKEPSKEMKGAMKVLNDNLVKSPSGEIPRNMRNAVNIVQQEWFKISSTADANPLDVEDYLDCFEELSVSLLEYIVNMTDVSGNTAMHYAVSNGNFDVVSILLDSKVCNINKLNTAGYTCIMLVALTKVKSDTDRQVVRRLFQMADVNIRARQHGQTALMLAVSHGRIDTVELLLESGADINIQDEDGSTALMCAAEHGYIDIVKLLLAQPDCDLSITDLDGNTALNIAMEAGNRDIGVLLYAQEHFSRGASPFSSMKVRRAKSATPTLKTRTPTPPNCSQEHSL